MARHDVGPARTTWRAATQRDPRGPVARRRRGTARLALLLAVLSPVGAVGLGTWRGWGPAPLVLAVAVGLLVAVGAVVAYGWIDQRTGRRHPSVSLVGAVLLALPFGLIALVLAVLLVVRALRGRQGPALQTGSVWWADLPNDEDGGRTSKVRPVLVVADRVWGVEVRWFTTQDKSARDDFVEVTRALHRAIGMADVGRSTWLSTGTKVLPRTAFQDRIGTAPRSLTDARPT